MSELSLTRHISIFNPAHNNVPIHIIGAGAVGSRLWLTLVELGLTNISIYDFDVVESHNLPNQLFLNRDIGEPKVEGLRKYYIDKTGAEPMDTMKFINKKIESLEDFPCPPSGVVFLAVDSMAARKELFGTITRNCTDVFLIIDTRIAASFGNVYIVNPFDATQCRRWINSLIDDADAELSPCGASITVSPTVNIITNIAVWQFINALTNPEALEFSVLMHLRPIVLGLNN